MSKKLPLRSLLAAAPAVLPANDGLSRPPVTVGEFLEYEFEAQPYGVFPRCPGKAIPRVGDDQRVD